MTDRIVIPLPGFGSLELPRELFELHLVRDAAPSPIVAAEVIDADELESRTGIPASWWMSQARERRVPFHKFGRYVRFNLAEVLACETYRRRDLKSAGQREQHGGAND